MAQILLRMVPQFRANGRRFGGRSGWFLAWLSLVLLPVSLQAQGTWTEVTNPAASSLNAVAFGNGFFVAVGEGGVIVTSSDGVNWVPRVSGTTDRLPAIAFGGGRFVATRKNRESPALTSTDGITWSPVTVSAADGNPTTCAAYDAIAFGDGRFIAVGSDQFEVSDVMESADGVAFRDIGPAIFSEPVYLQGTLEQIYYFRGEFYAIMTSWRVLKSTNGSFWNSFSGAAFMAFDDDRKVTRGSYLGSSFYSYDAMHTWLPAETAVDHTLGRFDFSRFPNMRRGCYGAGYFVGVDDEGRIWTSQSGEFWRPRWRDSVGGRVLRAVAFDGTSRFVAVGGATAGSGPALIVTAPADPPLPAPPAYSIRSLRDLSNATLVRAKSINNSGVVAGAVLNQSGQTLEVPATVADGVATRYDMGAYSFFTYGSARAVNSNGVVAGELTHNTQYSTYAVQLPGARRTYTQTFYSTACGINDNGIIAGRYITGPGVEPVRNGIYRFDTNTGQVTDLGDFGLGGLLPAGINDAGEIGGHTSTPWRLSPEGELTVFPVPFGGGYTWITGINAGGDLVGTSDLFAADSNLIWNTHAFILHRDGEAVDVDTLNTEQSEGRGLNRHGEVVGWFKRNRPGAGYGDSGEHAFLYTRGAMYELDSLLDASGDGWLLRYADGINDAGQIIGRGRRHNGADEVFLATPTTGSPAGRQTNLLNVSTRLRVGTGDDVLIAGFIVRGGAKRIIVRALGRSLGGINPISDPLQDPTLELLDASGHRLQFNDNFYDLSFAEENEISISVGGSFEDRHTESALIATLPEGNYTAVVRGKNGTTGHSLVEVYNIGTNYTPGLVNISTRGHVGTGDSVMIAGFIVRGDREKRVLIRGLGPSLAAANVSNTLADPMIEIHDGEGQIAANDNWRSTQEAEILASGIPPPDDRESAVVLSLWPGNYTAVVRGSGNATGNALVEVYALD